MSKFLGIDYGSKRIGIALSDAEGRLAFPKAILENKPGVLSALEEIIKKEGVQAIVIGESLNFKNQPNPVQDAIENFSEEIRRFGLPLYFQKEFWTTVESRKLKKGQRADANAAALILERFLERKNLISG